MKEVDFEFEGLKNNKKKKSKQTSGMESKGLHFWYLHQNYPFCEDLGTVECGMGYTGECKTWGTVGALSFYDHITPWLPWSTTEQLLDLDL